MIGTKYIVKKDDTLWDLSSKFLGDSEKWPLIYSHNNTPSIVKLTGSSIPEKDVIFVGQVLYIPETATKTEPKRIRYVYAKSKAAQYEKFKDSVFLKGVSAPVTKMRFDQITEANFDRKKHRQLTLRYLLARKTSNDAVQKLFRKIDVTPGLIGAGVIYMDRNFTLIKVRPTIRQDRLNVLIREVNQYDTLISLAKASENRRVISELLYAGLTCAGAALGYVALTAEGLAAPVTVGGTAFLIPITTAGTLASSASCGVYTGRVINEFTGNGSYNDYLDGSSVYGHVMTALDVASLISAVATIKSNATLIKYLTDKNMSKQTLFQRWKATPRADRKRLLKAIILEENRYVNNKQLKVILNSMNAPKVFSQARIRKAMYGELAGTIGSAFSTSASAADGVLNNFAVAIFAHERKD